MRFDGTKGWLMHDLDIPLPIDVPTAEPTPELEPKPMSALSTGSTLRSVPNLKGRWSVWSQSSETPGAHFIVPADDAAREVGVKYAVIRATMKRGSSEPTLSLVRTDPYIKGLCD